MNCYYLVGNELAYCENVVAIGAASESQNVMSQKNNNVAGNPVTISAQSPVARMPHGTVSGLTSTLSTSEIMQIRPDIRLKSPAARVGRHRRGRRKIPLYVKAGNRASRSIKSHIRGPPLIVQFPREILSGRETPGLGKQSEAEARRDEVVVERSLRSNWIFRKNRIPAALEKRLAYRMKRWQWYL